MVADELFGLLLEQGSILRNQFTQPGDFTQIPAQVKMSAVAMLHQLCGDALLIDTAWPIANVRDLAGAMLATKMAGMLVLRFAGRWPRSAWL
jgi:hypothetical protein